MNDLFFGLKPGDRIMVAFSGGVDSSYTAELCRDAGLEVETVTMNLFPEASDTAEKARSAARKAGFVHHELDLSREFESQIMRRTWEEYSAGLTPNPCAVCNPLFKFGILRRFALEHRCAAMATGHYARISFENGRTVLRRGVCREKDQSYFLFGVPAEALAFCRMPLGYLEKSLVRANAEKRDLQAAKQKDSQDICFGGGCMAQTLSELFHETPEPGCFTDENGKVLGMHNGVQFYTPGQRKGTNVALGKPAYVKSIDGESGNIVLTTDSSHLLSVRLSVRDCNFLADCGTEFECEVQVRYRGKPVRARVRRDGNQCEVEFETPVRAVAPGQAAVFYENDLVLGGGWIDREKQ